jgi:cyclopropane-fatty-acyl-phospholipid synthase
MSVPDTATGPSAHAHAGASPDALATHYEFGHDFFGLWLDPELVYSAGLWPANHSLHSGSIEAGLAEAQRRKIDYYGERMRLPHGATVIDVGCGWGGTLRRLADHHGVAAGRGITLSPAHERFNRQVRPHRAVHATLESWETHRAHNDYDAIVSLEAIEHFARDISTRAERIDIYRRFFETCYAWLKPGGAFGLQSILLEDMHAVGGGPAASFIRSEVYPESLPPYLSELAVAWDSFFTLESYDGDAEAHVLTLRSWYIRLRTQRHVIESHFAPETYERFAKYLTLCESFFRRREWAVGRIVLRARRRPRTQ